VEVSEQILAAAATLKHIDSRPRLPLGRKQGPIEPSFFGAQINRFDARPAGVAADSKRPIDALDRIDAPQANAA
jgi:hypothetical protein